MASVQGFQDLGGNPFDNLTAKLTAQNNDQTELAREAAVYSKELQHHLDTDGMNMSRSQLDALQALILTMKEGRLDDLESDKEQLLRDRMERRRDEERNDTLEDLLKNNVKAYKLLVNEFGDKGGWSIMGILIRTALLGFLVGVFKGFMAPYIAIGKGIINISKNIGKTLGFPTLFKNLKAIFLDFGARVKGFFGTMFKGKNTGIFARMGPIMTEIGKTGKDLRIILTTFGGNMIKILSGMTGFITGRFGAFEAFTKLKTSLNLTSKLGVGLTNGVNFLLKPLQSLKNLLSNLGGILAGGIDKAFNGIKVGTANFTGFGTKILNFIKNTPFLKTIFSFLGAFRGAFMVFGQLIGKLAWPVIALIGFVKGFFDGAKKETDGLNKFISGWFSGFKTAFRYLIGDFADLLFKDLPAWLLGLFGFDKLSEKLKGAFDISDFFDGIFDTISDMYIAFFNNLRDSIGDIGVSGIVKNMMISLADKLREIALFPAAIVAAASAALAAAVTFGIIKSPLEAFSDVYNATMALGKAKLNAKRVVADGRDSDGYAIDALTAEGQRLSREAQDAGAEKRPVIINNTNNSNKGGDTIAIGPDFNNPDFSFLGNQYSD